MLWSEAMKPLNLNQTVYEATQQYPELISIFSSWGFPQIRNGYLRKTIGSKFTLREAIKELGLNKSRVCESLKKHGFDVTE